MTHAEQAIVDTYDQLAMRYDAERFDNPYGRTIDFQERAVLKRWLHPYSGGRILDLACGTGRLLDLATHGLDASLRMVRRASRRVPSKPIAWNRADSIRADPGSFDAIFCLHLFKHLAREPITRILAEGYRVLRTGGAFIFDLPCHFRRSLGRKRPAGWYDSTSLPLEEVRGLTGSQFELTTIQGILLLPPLGLSTGLVRALRRLDRLAGRTPLKFLATAHLYLLRRR